MVTGGPLSIIGRCLRARHTVAKLLRDLLGSGQCEPCGVCESRLPKRIDRSIFDDGVPSPLASHVPFALHKVSADFMPAHDCNTSSAIFLVRTRTELSMLSLFLVVALPLISPPPPHAFKAGQAFRLLLLRVREKTHIRRKAHVPKYRRHNDHVCDCDRGCSWCPPKVFVSVDNHSCAALAACLYAPHSASPSSLLCESSRRRRLGVQLYLEYAGSVASARVGVSGLSGGQISRKFSSRLTWLAPPAMRIGDHRIL